MTTAKNQVPVSSSGQKFWPLKFTLGHGKTQNQTTDKQPHGLSSAGLHAKATDLPAKPRNRRLSSLLSHRRQPLEEKPGKMLSSAMSVQNLHLQATRPTVNSTIHSNQGKKGVHHPSARVGPRQRTMSQTVGSPTGTLPKDQMPLQGHHTPPVTSSARTSPVTHFNKSKEMDKGTENQQPSLETPPAYATETALVQEHLPLANYHQERLSEPGAEPLYNKKYRSIATSSMTLDEQDLCDRRRHSQVTRQSLLSTTRRNSVQQALRPVASCVTLRQSVPPSSPSPPQRTRSQRHSHDDTRNPATQSSPKEYIKPVMHSDSQHTQTQSPRLAPTQKKRVSIHGQVTQVHDAKNRPLEDSGVFCDSRLSDSQNTVWSDETSEQSASGGAPLPVVKRNTSNKSLFSFSGVEDTDLSSSSDSSYTGDQQTPRRQEQVLKDKDVIQPTSADSIRYLKCQLENERATVIALQRQKEACNKDIAFLSQNVDDLAEENQKLKEECQREQEQHRDAYATIVDMLNSATGKIMQLAADKETQGVASITDRNAACVHFQQLQRAQQQVKVLRTTMEQFLRLGIFGHEQELAPFGPACIHDDPTFQ